MIDFFLNVTPTLPMGIIVLYVGSEGTGGPDTKNRMSPWTVVEEHHIPREEKNSPPPPPPPKFFRFMSPVFHG